MIRPRGKFEFIFSVKNSKRLRKATVASCSVREICRILSVSKKGYYKRRRRRGIQSPRVLLLEEIRKIISEHQQQELRRCLRMRRAFAKRDKTLAIDGAPRDDSGKLDSSPLAAT